jgi:hypothetical protein
MRHGRELACEFLHVIFTEVPQPKLVSLENNFGGEHFSNSDECDLAA